MPMKLHLQYTLLVLLKTTQTLESLLPSVLGYTTCINQSGDSTPERGSAVFSDSSNTGKIRTDISASNNQARLGFVAQSNNGGGNSTLLIYFSGFYQPYWRIE